MEHPPLCLATLMTALLLDTEKRLIHHHESGDKCLDIHHQTCCDIACKYELWDDDRFPLWLSVLVEHTNRKLYPEDYAG